MSKLVERTPNVRFVSFSTDWFEMPFKSLAESLASRPLEELRLIQTGDITQLLGAVCKQIRRIPTLKHLYLQYSGQGSAYTNFIPPSELEEGSPGPSLEKVTLKIGSASSTSLKYINWLTRPRENGFQLKELALDLSGSYYNERHCIEALEPCFSTLPALCITVSGLSEGVLERVLEKCRALKDLSMIIRHSFDNSMSEIPRTIERLCISLSFEHMDWSLWSSRMHEFLEHRAPPRLRHLEMRMVAYCDIDGTYDPFREPRAIAKQKGIDVVITFHSAGCASLRPFASFY